MYSVLQIKKNTLAMIFLCVIIIFTAVFFTVKAEQTQQIEVPIIMYHSVLKDSAYHGDYVISPDAFEEDLIYLKESGYTTIGINDLIEYASGKGDLPEKPIVLSFDDGYYNNYLYAYPLAQKYNMKIVISPIAYHSEISSSDEHLSANYSHITVEQIQEMSESGFVEFGNHSYNLHDSNGVRLGIRQLAGENLEDYTAVLKEDILKAQKLLEQATNKNINLFVYPFGAISENTPKIIENLGFSVTFTCEERMNVINKDLNSLQDLGRYIRPYNKSVKEILEQEK